jgi:hypothetical protein
MVSDSKRISDDRQCRVYGATGWEEAAIHYVKVIEIVSLAIDV